MRVGIKRYFYLFNMVFINGFALYEAPGVDTTGFPDKSLTDVHPHKRGSELGVDPCLQPT